MRSLLPRRFVADLLRNNDWHDESGRVDADPLFRGHPLHLMKTDEIHPALVRRAHSCGAGFSLVEVALALAVAAFALVAVLGLMSSGVGGFRQVMDTTICAQIAQRVMSDAQQADFRLLTDDAALGALRDEPGFSFRGPRLAEPRYRYFDEQGIEIVPRTDTLTPEQRARVIYWVNTRVRPRAAVPRSDGRGTGELAQITVQVAANPNQLDLPLGRPAEPDTANLIVPGPGIRVLTYTTLVGRNE